MPIENTGQLIYNILIEINDRTSLPTGRTKLNIPSDPDYIPPHIDGVVCPLPQIITTTTTIPLL